MIIIGILAAIAIPVFLNQRQGAQVRAAEANVRNAATAEQAYATDTGAYTADTSLLSPYGFPTGGDPAVTVSLTGGGTGFCATATSASGTTFGQDENDGVPQEGGCSP